jgi:uncharacterized radical SAM superfamily Fe-S cluster-containing enzyme
MTELLARTESLCPFCLRRVPARRVVEDGRVFLEKSCPEHGDTGRVLLWRNSPRSYNEWSRTGSGQAIEELRIISGETGDRCPYECGLYPHHAQNTCTAIIEVSHRCNLRCAFCFAGSGTSSDPDPDMGAIEEMFEFLLHQSGPCPIQLSGGEPTLRDDLPQIVALARKMGFDHIQINTNGIRLAQDMDYGLALRDAGVTVFFLQFDGVASREDAECAQPRPPRPRVTEDVHLRIRGANLLPLKIKAIERCAELRVGVILVSTLVKGINDGQIGSMIQFAKGCVPTVKGIHFQPLTYLGRYPNPPRNEDRVLIPDILAAIEDQTGGEIKMENLVPPG